MLTSPSAHLLFKLNLINRRSEETDWIYEAIVKWPLTRPRLTSIQVHSKHQSNKWPLKWISVSISMFFFLGCNMVPANWQCVFTRGFTYILCMTSLDASVWPTVPTVITRKGSMVTVCRRSVYNIYGLFKFRLPQRYDSERRNHSIFLSWTV